MAKKTKKKDVKAKTKKAPNKDVKKADDETKILLKDLRNKGYILSGYFKKQANINDYIEAYKKLEILFQYALMCKTDLGLLREVLDLDNKFGEK